MLLKTMEMSEVSPEVEENGYDFSSVMVIALNAISGNQS